MSYFLDEQGGADTGELPVRNVVDDLIRRLRNQAAASGAALRAQHRNILQEARLKRASFAERAARWRSHTAGCEATDSTELIRADRDRDYPT